MKYLANNMKYIIWSVKQQRQRMDYTALIDELAGQCGIPAERFKNILGDKVDASKEEIESIKKMFGKYDSENVPYFDVEYLYAGAVEEHKAQLIYENIQYLLHSIPWGNNQDFIESLQIQASTLNRWKNGTMKPSKFYQEKICKYFGVQGVDDLKESYLFLGLSPASTTERKMQIKRMIDSIDKESFEMVYSALVKLLE